MPEANSLSIAAFEKAIDSAAASIENWKTSDDVQTARIVELQGDLRKLRNYLDGFDFNQDSPWDAIYHWGQENLVLEALELLVSGVIEPHGELVDDLLDTMSADEELDFRINGQMTVFELKSIISTHYDWALSIDYALPENCARFWYVSSNKAEPRLGERADEGDADKFEEPLDIGRDISNLNTALDAFDDDCSLSHVLVAHPQFRKSVRRIQTVMKYPYGEIYDNLISSTVRPIDMLRCKLSFFGATDFDPRSDRWVRITMFKNAPYPHELESDDEDNWAYRSSEVSP